MQGPVSARQGSGKPLFDVVPGKPDESILVHRMESAAPKVMTPELGRTLAHDDGVALIREWVASLQGKCASHRPGVVPQPARATAAGHRAAGISGLIRPPYE